MSNYTSQVGSAQVGFAQVGEGPTSNGWNGAVKCTGAIAAVSLVVVAAGAAICTGIPKVTLNPALGVVGTSGQIPAGVTIAAAKIRVTQLVGEVVQEFTANANIRVTQIVAEVVIEALPFFAATGLATCSGKCTATTFNSASCLGVTQSSGQCAASQQIPAVALGAARALGSVILTVQLIGAAGTVTASGRAAAALGVKATGIASASGKITATGNFLATALGTTSTSGKIPSCAIVAAALGIVNTLSSCVPPLIGSSQACLTGGTGPATGIAPGNRVY